MENLMKGTKSPNDESFFQEGGSSRIDQSCFRFAESHVAQDFCAGLCVANHGSSLSILSSAGGAKFVEPYGEWDVGGHANRFSHSCFMKAILTYLRFQRSFKSLLASPHEVMHIATESKLESFGRMFQSNPGVGGYSIVPTDGLELAHTDDLALQIEKLAELGLPSRLVEMIKEIPDAAAQRYIVKDFQTYVRNVMGNAFNEHLELKLMKLLVTDLGTYVGNYTVRRNGLLDVHINMPKEDNVPADQFHTYVGEGRRDGSPEVRIDMPKEVIVPAEQKNPHLPGGSVADIVKKEGVAYLNSLPTNVPGPSWANSAIGVAKIFGYVSTTVGHGKWNDKLSQFFIKAGAIATAASVIASLAMPLPAVVAWTVGPLALFIVAAAILFN